MHGQRVGLIACRTALVLLLLLAHARPARGQTPALNSAVRVFLDCNFSCDEDYTRREITFVDYVRDRTEADVHILITTGC